MHQLRRRRDQARRHREFLGEARELAEVMTDATVAAAGRVGQHVGGDERVAVTVAADPRADAQQRPLAGRGPRAEGGVDRRLRRGTCDSSDSSK